MGPAGSGWKHDRLFDALGTVNSALELDVVLERIVAAACELADAEYGALGVIGDDRGLVEYLHDGIDDAVSRIGHAPERPGMLGLLIDDSRPRRLSDLATHARSSGMPAHRQPMRGFLSVPIRVRGDVYGNLYLCDKIAGEKFSEADESLVLALAEAAGSAIANARLFEEVNRRHRSLLALQGIATALLGGARADDVLGLVGFHARDILHADTAVIAVPVQGARELRITVAVGEGADELAEMVLPLDGSLSGAVVRTGRPAFLDDAGRDARMFRPKGDAAGAGPAAYVPLWTSGSASGVLAVLRQKGAPVFDEEDVAVLQSFAVQAGLALEHANTLHEFHRLEVLRDEERIAGGLHNVVVQRLFSAGLNLNATMLLVRDPFVRDRVQRAIDEIDGGIRGIRSAVFGVDGPPAGPGPR